MELSAQKVKDIKVIFEKFIKHNAFNESEAHIESSYTLDILKVLGWDESKWSLNKSTERNTGLRPDILLKGDGGGIIFVIESKKATESLSGGYHGKKSFGQQICDYIDSEGISWGILTNFREWAIYNSHNFKANKTAYKKPLKIISEDKQIVCSDNDIKDFFSLITNVFLNENKGKIDTGSAYYPKQDEIKDEFFKNLKKWRADLRTHLNKTQKNINGIDELDNQTQKILDRLIFIDFCYDKNIISQDYLGISLFSKNIYDSLKDKFRTLDELFNSEIFSEDKCDKFNISNDAIGEIIKGIRRIDFSNMNAHIMGEVYENYLGEILKEGKSKISTGGENKEHLKRKSHGIFYTPEYIVKYIVENTLGKILKKCNDVGEIEKIKVIDISSGSGSFLIQAFDMFYDAYIRFEKHFKTGYEIEISKKILLHNIYGVDIDERAVEIAKLNLLLRALDKMPKNYKVTGRKILPNLSLNIRYGNSLISGINDDEVLGNEEEQLSLQFIFDKQSDYKENLKRLYELKKQFYLEENNIKKEDLKKKVLAYEININDELNKNLQNYFKDTEKVKAFNYEVAFCEVMKNGGFDCVFTNPPYIPIEIFSNSEKEYYKKIYPVLNRKYDSSALFILKGINLLKEGGCLGVISTQTWQTGENYSDFRKQIIKDNGIVEIINLPFNIFEDAYVDTGIFTFSKTKKDYYSFYSYNKKESIKDIEKIPFDKIYISDINEPDYKIITNNNVNQILQKLKSNNYTELGNISISTQGLSASRFINAKNNKSKWILPFVNATVKRYNFIKENEYLVDLESVQSLYKFYLKSEKILIRRIINRQDRIDATLFDKQGVFKKDLNPFIITDDNYSTKYILALINSKLFSWIYINTSLIATKNDFRQTTLSELRKLPVRKIDFKNQNKKKIQDKLIRLVEKMLELNKYYEKNENSIFAVDLEIDDLVYNLYGISGKDRDIIDSTFAK